MAKEPEVKYTQAFSAVIRETPDGKRLVVGSPKYYAAQLQKFRDGEYVTLMVHNRKPKRSEAQNRFYWGIVLPLVSDKTGEADLDKLHRLFRGKFLSEGIVEVLGEKVRVTKSTTELSKGEFHDYIVAIQNLTGIEIPPTDSWYEISTGGSFGVSERP